MVDPKIVKKKLVYKGNIFNVYEEDIILGNGVNASRQIVEKNDSCTMMVVNEDTEKVLIENEYRSAINKVVAGFPAGLVNDKEDPYLTARRELSEETGLVINPKKFQRVGVYTLSEGFTTEHSHVFLVRVKNTDIKRTHKNFDSDEYVDKQRWVSINSAIKKVHSAAANLAIKEYLYQESLKNN